MPFLRRHLPLLLALVLAIPCLTLGLTWGLPSRSVDPLLFGARTPWTGEQILALAGDWKTAPDTGADVDQNPIADRSAPVELTATDADRARLVLRYRLYTYQPDEMINLRAFARMNPGEGRLDPGLYQYGGVWIYGSALALKVASTLGLVELRSQLAFYLDHPEAVGRVYVVLRAVSVLWAVLGVAAVYVLVRQMALLPMTPPGPAGEKATDRALRQAGWVAGICALAFAAMPGVVVFVREAKPHVAGLALVLWSAVWAVEFLRSRKFYFLALCSLFAGLAFGAVLLYAVAILVPLGVLVSGVVLRRLTIAQAGLGLLIATGLFAAAYGVTNPYVVRHLFFDPDRLTNQLGNSAAMYGLGNLGEGVQTAFVLLMSLTPAVLMVFPAVGLMLTERKAPALAYALGPVAAVLLVLFVVLAGSEPVGLGTTGGKPGEFARFGLLLGAVGVLLAGFAAYRFSRPVAVPLAVLIFHLLMSVPEILGYVHDSGPDTSRLEAARLIASTETDSPLIATAASPLPLAVRDEPAPYNTPPVDLWRNRLILLPRGAGSDDVRSLLLRQPPRSDGYWRMSWADRGFSWQKLDPPAPPHAPPPSPPSPPVPTAAPLPRN